MGQIKLLRRGFVVNVAGLVLAQMRNRANLYVQNVENQTMIHKVVENLFAKIVAARHLKYKED